MSVLLTIQLTMPVSIGVWIVGFIVLTMAVSVVSLISEPVLIKKDNSDSLPQEDYLPLMSEGRSTEDDESSFRHY